MDLIYTDSSGSDEGVLKNYEMDFDIGDTEDFELRLPINAERIAPGSFVYAERSEIFGIVDEQNVDGRTIAYCGRTIRGIMNKKVVEPDPGQDYKTLNGDLIDILNGMSADFGIGSIVKFASAQRYTVKNYKVDRYISFLATIEKLLKNFGLKMTYNYTGVFMLIDIVPAIDYSDNVEYDSNNTVRYKIDQKRQANHLICLGKGELAARQVIHLYADAEGNVSKIQTMYGINEMTEVYDYSSSESIEELEKSGVQKLQEYNSESVDITVDAQMETVGDIVGTYDSVTGKTIKGTIVSKVIKVKNNAVSVECKVGEAK